MITEPSNPTEETKSNGDTFAEEHFNDPNTENADQRRQAHPEKNPIPDEKESTPNYAVDCPDTPNHDKLQRENEFKQIFSPTYQRCRLITSKAHELISVSVLGTIQRRLAWPLRKGRGKIFAVNGGKREKRKGKGKKF